jgi:iron complex outermembrane receptor protein
MPTSAGDFDFRLSFSHIDEHNRSYVDSRIAIDSADLWEGRIGWSSNDGDWGASLWAKNLTDEDYISHLYVIGPGGIGVWGPPRTVGLTVNRSFD